MVDSHWGFGMSGWEPCLSNRRRPTGKQGWREGKKAREDKTEGRREGAKERERKRREGRKRAMGGMGGEVKEHWAT